MNRVAQGAILAILVAASSAHAGGLARPNIISARGVGLGGAFTAIADDPTAWYANPAGAAWADDGFAIGAEFVYAPRSYTPVDAAGTRGPAQTATAVAPLPALGVIVHPRIDGAPSRLALGAGIWNNFGGQIHYPKMADPAQRAINSTTDLVFEVGAGAAYEVDDTFAIGGTLRLGVGVFSVDANSLPLDANLSASGVGVSATLGALFRPTPKLTIGASWRAGMDIATAGSGQIGAMGTLNVKHVQKWPQIASLAVAVAAASKLKVTGQLDWTQWSRFDRLSIEFPDNPSLVQILDFDWNDTWTVRGGAEYGLAHGAIRAGAYYDTSAVPDRTIERTYLDSNKIGVAVGGSAMLGAWRFDGALDFTLPGTRKVPDNRPDFSAAAWATQANIAPGEHSGSVLTLELAAMRRI